MEKIEEAFNRTFSNWEIRLPSEDIASRQSGKIVQAGWTIWFLFGSDENGEYLDYYSSHRMTNDTHVRIHADGSKEYLEALNEGYVVSQGASPEEVAQAKENFYRRNKAVAKMLNEKGFLLRGDEHPSAGVRRYLLTTPEEERRRSTGTS